MIKFKLKLTRFFIAIGLLCSLSNCLFEDQAGTYDWRQQYVGRPLFSHIDSNLNRVYLATDQNVLTALNMKTGNIAWRKIFEANDNGKIDLALWAAKEAVVVTGNGLRVQSFSYNLGFANWEYNLFSPQAKRTNIVGIESKQENQVYYLTNGYQLCYVSQKDKVCVELPLDGGYVYGNLLETDQGIYIFGIKNDQVQKLHYSHLLTALLSKSQFTEESTSYENCINSFDSNEIACYSSQKNRISISQITNSNNQFELKGQQISSASLFDSLTVNLVHASKTTLLFRSISNAEYDRDNHAKVKLFLISRDNLSLIKKLDSVNNYDILEKSSNDIYLVYSNYLGLNKLNFNVLNLKNGQERNDLVVSVNSAEKDYKSIIYMKTKLIESRNNQFTLNTLCFFSDYSLSLFNEQGVSYFSREEALAYITSVEMIDFPLLHLQEEFEDEFGHSEKDNLFKMFFKRIKTQLIQLKEFIAIDLNQKLMNYINNGNFKTRNTGTNNNALSAEEITRDEFNLNKLMVIGTSVGKVFGLYTGDNGRILWSFYLKNLRPFRLNKMKQEVYMPLFLQRTAAHFPFDPQCVLIARTSDAKTRVFFFNPITGLPAKDYPKEGYLVDYEVKLAFLSTQPDSQFLKPLFLFDKQNILHVLPEKSINDLEIRSQSKPAILFSTLNDSENRTNTLVGYGLKFDSKELPEVWRINLEDEQIAAIASKLPNDRIHSHGKVLGDRSVLYKYLNPNLIGVVTTGQDSQKVPFVNVYLVDTVTGSVIYSLNYKRCKGPVHIVHSENWFFFSYYNIKFRRNEVTSIELFEGSTQFNSSHFSSLDDIKPVVYTKSYIVQKSFDAMQVTLTEKGISTKDIIVACQYGIIVEIPWILIDPRRPLKMTDIEREENLLPYMPEIPLNFEFSLNYYNYVYNVRGITTSPSGLESTSLVFCYGLDIFFTRVFPSKTFDMLREDFDFFFITTLMVGLVLGTVLSKKLASSSNLKKAWK